MAKEKKRWIIRIGDYGYFCGWSKPKGTALQQPLIGDIKGADRFGKKQASELSLWISECYWYSTSVAPAPVEQAPIGKRPKGENNDKPLTVDGGCAFKDPEALLGMKHPSPEEVGDQYRMAFDTGTGIPPGCQGCEEAQKEIERLFGLLHKYEDREEMLLDIIGENRKKLL